VKQPLVQWPLFQAEAGHEAIVQFAGKSPQSPPSQLHSSLKHPMLQRPLPYLSEEHKLMSQP
jgi:hypothetical protein